MSSKGGAKDKGWKTLVAGGLSGTIEGCFVYPTEVRLSHLCRIYASLFIFLLSFTCLYFSLLYYLQFVKTKMQLARSMHGANPYKGPLDCAIQTVKEKGVLGLYSGVSTIAVGSFCKAAVRFFSYDTINRYVTDNGRRKGQQYTVLSGLGAGICEAVFAVTPTETIKTKIIHDQFSASPRYKGLVHGISLMVKEEGIQGIYRGVVPTMLKQGCNQATRFLVYTNLMDVIKTYRKTSGSSSVPPAWLTALTGGAAGFFSVYVTMPFDIVKTRMQGLERAQYKNSFDCLTSIYRKEGLKAYWRGTTPRLLRVSLSTSILFTCYEQIMGVLNKMVPNK